MSEPLHQHSFTEATRGEWVCTCGLIRRGTLEDLHRPETDADATFAIARELAESDPADETSFGCVHCGEELPRHLDTCLWLRAHKLVGMV